MSLCSTAAQHALRIAHRGFFPESQASPNLQAVASLRLVHLSNWKVKLQRVVRNVSLTNKPLDIVDLNDRAKLFLFGGLIVLSGAATPPPPQLWVPMTAFFQYSSKPGIVRV